MKQQSRRGIVFRSRSFLSRSIRTFLGEFQLLRELKNNAVGAHRMLQQC